MLINYYEKMDIQKVKDFGKVALKGLRDATVIGNIGGQINDKLKETGLIGGKEADAKDGYIDLKNSNYKKYLSEFNRPQPNLELKLFKNNILKVKLQSSYNKKEAYNVLEYTLLGSDFDITKKKNINLAKVKYLLLSGKFTGSEIVDAIEKTVCKYFKTYNPNHILTIFKYSTSTKVEVNGEEIYRSIPLTVKLSQEYEDNLKRVLKIKNKKIVRGSNKKPVDNNEEIKKSLFNGIIKYQDIKIKKSNNEKNKKKKEYNKEIIDDSYIEKSKDLMVIKNKIDPVQKAIALKAVSIIKPKVLKIINP